MGWREGMDRGMGRWGLMGGMEGSRGVEVEEEDGGEQGGGLGDEEEEEGIGVGIGVDKEWDGGEEREFGGG